MGSLNRNIKREVSFYFKCVIQFKIIVQKETSIIKKHKKTSQKYKFHKIIKNIKCQTLTKTQKKWQ